VPEFTQTSPGPPPGAGVLADLELADLGLDEAAEEVEAAGAGDCFGAGAGAAAGAGVEAVALAEELDVPASAAYQVSTPLCPRQAPCFLGVEVNVPSLHFPVVPAGAPAGA
jgi:hypothetical protein